MSPAYASGWPISSRKGDTTIMIDAGYNYERLEEKMGWLGIDPKSIRHILITHQDTDHVGAVEADSPGLFKEARLYIGEIENRYLTGEVRRKVIYHMYKLPQVTILNPKQLLQDGETFYIDDIKIHCFLVPGHTWGHMVYLIDDTYLFTGDTLWFGADGIQAQRREKSLFPAGERMSHVALSHVPEWYIVIACCRISGKRRKTLPRSPIS